MSKTKQIIRVLGFVFYAVLVGALPLFLAEIYLRFFPPAAWTPLRPAVMIPPNTTLAATDVFVPYAEESGRVTVRQRYGHPHFAAHPPANEKTVFCLGGSTTEGWKTNPFCGRVATELTQQTGNNYVAVNVGFSGKDLFFSAELVRIILHDFSPALLIVYAAHNEFLWDYENHSYYPLVEVVMPPWWPASATLADRLAIMRYYKQDQPAAWQRSTSSAIFRRSPWHAAITAKIFHRFENTLAAMVAAARSRHVPIIVCTGATNLRKLNIVKTFGPQMEWDDTQEVLGLLDRAAAPAAGSTTDELAQLFQRAWRIDPTYAPTHQKWAEALLRLYNAPEKARLAFEQARDLSGVPFTATTTINEIIRRVAGEQGALLVDAEKLFQQTDQGGVGGIPNPALFQDDVHPTDYGQGLLAERMLLVINENRLFVTVEGKITPQ